MRAVAAYRGQPLFVLAVLLGGWIALRALLWQPPFGVAVPPRQAPAGVAAQAPAAPVPAMAGPPSAGPRALPPPYRQPAAPGLPDWRAANASGPAIASPPEALPTYVPPLPVRAAAGHSLMLMAGFARLGLPPEIARLFAPRGDAPPAAAPFRPLPAAPEWRGEGRWSADAWLLLREDTATPATSGRGSYGRSQAGAVLRYRLLPASGHRPTAYLRASQALAGSRESEAALGLSARPLPGLPLAAAAELRLTRSGGRTLARPAAYAVTELPPFELPGGFTGEAYLQAGYVGGDFATGFADGQLRAERKLFELGPAELHAGGGAWGGAQKGAARLDVGPGATLRLEFGEAPSRTVPARVSMDWRFRVAGQAEPKSGPALTISAGF